MSPATDDRAVPAHAHGLAAQLSVLFQRDVEIVKQLNDAHDRLADANERLWSGLAPDAFGVLYDSAAAAAIGTSPIAALIRDGGAAANSAMLEALQQVRWTIHRAFCRYQFACEERRQLAVEVGELSHRSQTRSVRPAGAHWRPSRPTYTSSPEWLPERRTGPRAATVPA